MKYKLVSMRNLGEDKAENLTKIYAQTVAGDYITFEQFVEEVSDSSGVGSTGVKAVLDRANVVLGRHLPHGRRVSMGSWGRSVSCWDRRGCLIRKILIRT
ncbi:MAG: hypothetical protein LUD46_06680 [Parabacteroides sp.]|nr:hypothetical protein [Parabacteroides sp.]